MVEVVTQVRQLELQSMHWKAVALAYWPLGQEGAQVVVA